MAKDDRMDGDGDGDGDGDDDGDDGDDEYCGWMMVIAHHECMHEG
jgi:hypothetical protein